MVGLAPSLLLTLAVGAALAQESSCYNLSSMFPNSSTYPRVSTAISGGGYRASLFGAGTLSSLDSRNATHVAPLLQLSDYLSGLSGGSWCVSSLAMNDLPDLFSLVLGGNGQNGWMLDLALLDPAGILGISDNSDYYDVLFKDVDAKGDAGFPVSLVDVWGRALSFHFFNGTSRSTFYTESTGHDQGLLWSSIKYTLNFDNYAMPLPIVVTTSRVSEAQQTSNTSDLTVIPLSNTHFEFTPYTFGSFDPTLMARVPIEYAGTYLDNGVPRNSSACANGYENAGFVIGSSAALFNAVEQVFTDPAISAALTTLGDDLANINNVNSSIPLVANWPNSWKNFVPSGGGTFESAGNNILQITDGGENGENVPISPLLVKVRAQDLIYAVDASADTDYAWPNGTSLIATAARVASFHGNFSSFPPIPATADDFVSEGLNVRPTFFGCNTTESADTSLLGSYPIVVYLPNAPPPSSANGSTYLTNVTTLTLDYSQDDTLSFMNAAHLNGLKGFETGSETSDPNWPLALKCALVDRARKRAGVERTAACAAQLNKYCWSDGIAEALQNYTSSQTSPSGSKSAAPAGLGVGTHTAMQSPLAASPSRVAGNKRAASYFDDDSDGDDDEFDRAPKKLAAQASRDRKKAQSQVLEQKVAELEAQLAATAAAESRAGPATISSLVPPLALPPIARPTASLEGVPLEVENESLRTQLHEERLHSAALKARLGTLETRFSMLEALFSTPIASSSTPAAPLASPSPSYSHLAPLPPLPSSALSPAHVTDPHRASDVAPDPLVPLPLGPRDLDADLDLAARTPLDEFAFANAWADWEQSLPQAGTEATDAWLDAPPGLDSSPALDLFDGGDLFAYLQDAPVPALC
ncbi:hypothetical protein RQP46_004771 [Phenoliferia psychrophenolica]